MDPSVGAEQSRKSVAIDVHAHIIAPSVGDHDNLWTWMGNPLSRTPDGALESPARPKGFRPEYEATPDGIEARLREMDELKIDMQIISLLPSLWMYGVEGHDSSLSARRSNDELAEVAATHPRRFRTFAHLPLDRPAQAVTELERAIGYDGVVGAAVGTNVQGLGWDDPTLFPILEAAEALGAVLFLHPMKVRFPPRDRRGYHLGNLIGNPSETTLAAAHLIFGGVLERLPRLKVVLAHGGGYSCFAIGRFDHGHSVRPEAQEHIVRSPSEYLRQMYFDNLLHDERATRYVMDTVGSGHVLLGTDYPADMGPTAAVERIMASDTYADAEKRDVLGANLAALLELDVNEIGSHE